jgi:putative acetyltransferase
VPITIHQGELDRSDVQELLALHVAAMRAHSPPEACHVLPGSALAHPSITFFTAREGAQLLGIGALKDLGDGTGEIKSMRKWRRGGCGLPLGQAHGARSRRGDKDGWLRRSRWWCRSPAGGSESHGTELQW